MLFNPVNVMRDFGVNAGRVFESTEFAKRCHADDVIHTVRCLELRLKHIYYHLIEANSSTTNKNVMQSAEIIIEMSHFNLPIVHVNERKSPEVVRLSRLDLREYIRIFSIILGFCLFVFLN